jgi:hypothetical protein
MADKYSKLDNKSRSTKTVPQDRTLNTTDKSTAGYGIVSRNGFYTEPKGIDKIPSCRNNDFYILRIPLVEKQTRLVPNNYYGPATALCDHYRAHNAESVEVGSYA